MLKIREKIYVKEFGILNMVAIRDWQLREIVMSKDKVQHIPAMRRTERKMKNRPYATRL